MKVQVINKSKNELPTYATKGDAGFDLKADFSELHCKDQFIGTNAYITIKDEQVESIIIRPLGRAIVPTNLFTAIPEGYEVQVRSRSGLAIKKGIIVLNAPGTIDSGFRNGWGVILINLGSENFKIVQGDKIAQGVLAKVEEVEWEEVESLSESERGLGGFGHTGVSSGIRIDELERKPKPLIKAEDLMEETVEESVEKTKKRKNR